MTRTLRYLAPVLAGLLLSTTALADPPGRGDGKKNDDKKEQRDARRDGGPNVGGDASVGDDKDKDKDRDERRERRKAHMAELRAKWGTILKIDGVKDEMRVHSSRLARLRRIAKLGRAANKDGVVKRAETAIEKEKARHDKKMDELKAKAAPAASASGGAK